MNCINPVVMTPLGIATARTLRDDGFYEYVKNGRVFQEWECKLFPCRKCVHCVKMRSFEWSVRCQLEAKLHKKNCVLTLTYDNDNVVRSVSKRHIQLFIKRLRKFIKCDVRYFVASEYGSHTMRAHYHMILFGWSPSVDDCRLWLSKNGHNYYRMFDIERLWRYGMVTIDLNASADAISYCVGYITQKYLMSIPQGALPPFQLMSRRPAIGLRYFQSHKDEIYHIYDSDVLDNLYFNGEVRRPPKYFDRKFREISSETVYDKMVDKRLSKIKYQSHKIEVDTSIYRARELTKKVIESRKKKL